MNAEITELGKLMPCTCLGYHWLDLDVKSLHWFLSLYRPLDPISSTGTKSSLDNVRCGTYGICLWRLRQNGLVTLVHQKKHNNIKHPESMRQAQNRYVGDFPKNNQNQSVKNSLLVEFHTSLFGDFTILKFHWMLGSWRVDDEHQLQFSPTTHDDSMIHVDSGWS